MTDIGKLVVLLIFVAFMLLGIYFITRGDKYNVKYVVFYDATTTDTIQTVVTSKETPYVYGSRGVSYIACHHPEKNSFVGQMKIIECTKIEE